MEYEKVLKHCKRALVPQFPQSYIKSVSKGVYHSGNIIRASDGCRLMEVEIEGADFEENIWDIKRNEVVEGKYPEFKNTFLENDSDITFEISEERIKGLKQVLTCIKRLGYKNVVIFNSEGFWYIEPQYTEQNNDKLDNSVTINYRFSVDSEKHKEAIIKHFNVTYLLNAIDFLNEVKEIGTRVRMANKSMTPIQFSNNEFSDFKYKYLVLPTRPF
ncbi:hypothetical protein [Staphylococcus equorum]|uniref:Uncharacterized protein n=1 Tax=Staphylococcus equorum TaxID=246432 RepID=A0AAP7IFI6_9STAP|nr:hypothetical protein [Staphylococcus equorum]OEK58972.1 hypothetical protein ASS94_01200 [Staphylococcus equorum]